MLPALRFVGGSLQLPCLFSFLCSLLSFSEKSSSKLCFYEKEFDINEGKSSQKTSSISSQTWDRHIFWNQKTCGVSFTSRACSSCSYVHLKLQT